MAEATLAGGYERRLAESHRADAWWAEPVLTFAGLSAFVVYATWAAFQGAHYYSAPYLSPFYSPPLFVEPSAPGAIPLAHAWLGSWPAWWPAFLPASPAFFILIFPGAFRFTCYYYRKAYYRSFAATPPACAVGPLPRRNYLGETGVMVFQNLHRYAMYFAVLFVFILAYDALHAFFRDGQFGVGVGTFVLLINVMLLGGYTFGCHSFRHLIGGGLNCFSCNAACGVRHGLWQRVTRLNEHHMFWAWVSLIWVMLTDLYVRLVSMGLITDLNTWSD